MSPTHDTHGTPPRVPMPLREVIEKVRQRFEDSGGEPVYVTKEEWAEVEAAGEREVARALADAEEAEAERREREQRAAKKAAEEAAADRKLREAEAERRLTAHRKREDIPTFLAKKAKKATDKTDTTPRRTKQTHKTGRRP